MAKEKERKSKLIRVSNDTLELLAPLRENEGTWGKAVMLLAQRLKEPVLWVAPGHLHPTERVARKYAIQDAAKQGKDYEEVEQPIPVRGETSAIIEQ